MAISKRLDITTLKLAFLKGSAYILLCLFSSVFAAIYIVVCLVSWLKKLSQENIVVPNLTTAGYLKTKCIFSNHFGICYEAILSYHGFKKDILP